ncbi:uncharacterized protein LOC135479055 isoform X2 [Liolophura sinensis]
MEESKGADEGEQLLLVDTTDLQLNQPDMEKVRHDRMDRNRHLMSAVNPSVANQVLPTTDNLPREHKAAVCIQRHVQGHLDRKRYVQLLLEQFEEEEKMRLEKTMKQVEEGQLLVENHQLEVEFDDNQTTRRNKKRHYLSNVITLQRAWRAYKRNQCGRDAGNNNMSPHSPVSEPDLSESDSAHGPQGMSVSTPDDTTPSLSTENEIQSDFESVETPELGSPVHCVQDGESESVVSDVSELAAPLKVLAETEVDIVQNVNQRKESGCLPLARGPRSSVTSVGIIERNPRETDEEFSKRVRKLNFLSLAQEFAELKKIDANALPFDLHKGRRFVCSSESPDDSVDGESGASSAMEAGELTKGDYPPSGIATLPKNFKLVQGMSKLSTAGDGSLPKNHQLQQSSASSFANPPKNAVAAMMKDERKLPANMGRNSPAKERSVRKASMGSSERLEDFDVYNIETTLPQMDWETLEQQLQLAAAEEEKKKEARRNDREEIRRKLAMGTGDEDYYYGERAFKKPSLQTRLQSGMNLQICFMNEATLAGDGDGNQATVEKGVDGEKVPPSSSSPQSGSSLIEKKSSPIQNDKKPLSNSPPKHKTGELTVKIDEPVEDEDFFKKQARLQAEARLALAQASTMAHMQLEVERQMKKKSPIADMVGIPGFGDGRRHKLTRKMMEGMNLAQIQVLVNDLHSQIENLNEDLVRMLVERDDLHMEQDSMLVDIEDLTRR